MIDFSRASLRHIAAHFVGNKANGENLVLSESELILEDEFVKENLLKYFLTPFKTDVYYEFSKQRDGSVRQACDKLFSGQGDFVKASREMASYLYDQGLHPKIKSGELFICYFAEAKVDGVVCDAIGFFKSENKVPFITTGNHSGDVTVDCALGIEINKLDKGCIVFNTDRKNGYKLSVIDTNNRVAECALYWQEDFLSATLKPGAFYHTSTFLETSRGFCEEVLTPENNVKKEDQQMMLNRSTSFFRDRDKFDMAEFEKSVLVEPEVIGAFKEYRDDFAKRMDRTAIDEFDVSATAVKKNQKYMRSVVKLDKNFHVYIHAKHEFVEKGYDEEKGMKFYKLYYVNEE